MKKIQIVPLLVCAALLGGCATASISAKEQIMEKVGKTYKADANQTYYAVRWALKECGYTITTEDLQNGTVKSGWVDSKADSFYLNPFGHPDYGANGAYYMLELNINPEEGTGMTRVDVTAHVKSMQRRLHSSKAVEKKVLKKVTEYLRKPDIELTNIGIEE